MTFMVIVYCYHTFTKLRALCAKKPPKTARVVFWLCLCYNISMRRPEIIKDNIEALLAKICGEDVAMPKIIANDKEFWLTQILTHIPIQFTEMPEASTELEGKIVQYVGQTNSDYNRGFFYDCVYDYSPASVSVVNNTGTNTVSVNAETYSNAIVRTDIPVVCSFVGLPKTVSVFRYNNGSDFATLTRETMYDRQQTGGSGGIQMISVQYGWVDGANNVYYTRTEIPDIGDKFYEPASYDIAVMSSNDSGYEVVSIDVRYTSGNGYWVLGGNDYPEDLTEYGITITSTPSIGDRFTMTYNAEVDNGYRWQMIQQGGV